MTFLAKDLAAFIALLFLWLSPRAQNPSAPFSLRVDLLRNPSQGTVNSRFPSFSWATTATTQQAYQIIVSTGNTDSWNSEKQLSDKSTAIIYKGPALQPSNTYHWKVRIWSNGHPSPYSPPQTFRTGNELKDFALPSFSLIKTTQSPTIINNTLYDFGKDAFAQPKLTVTTSNTHDTLLLHLGEALDKQGHINVAPPGSVRYRALKIPLPPGHHTYEPAIQPDARNTAKNAIHMPADIGEVLPFRYAEIESVSQGTTIDTVTRYAITRDFDDGATTFTSSDTTLNQIWNLCKYTIKATSFSGYYVDGDRERIPYEADALIAQLSDYASDADYTMAGRTLDYLIYHPTWPTEWSLQNILIAWYDYLYTGDARLIKKLYPDLKAKLLSSLAREDGLVSTRTGKQTQSFLQSIHFESFNESTQLRDIVDWPPPGFSGPNSKGETDAFVFTDYNAVVNAFYYYDLTIMSRLATALGKPADTKNYTREAARVHAAYQHTFINPQTNLVVDGEGTTHSSLHANFFALAFGLVPKTAQPSVIAFIHSRDMACSVYGAQFLLDALASANDADYALNLITSKDKRSWYNMIREGATMTMEAWGQEYKGNQDWNHAWGTAPANYIVRHLAGIEPLTPGFAEIQIKPHPGSLQSATLKYQTIRGQIEEHFENTPNYFHLEVTLPGNTLTRVYLPANARNSTNPLIKMDGHTIKPIHESGYMEIKNVPPGPHSFEVSP